MPFPKNLPGEAILDSLADGLFTVDPEWNVTFFNHAAERITGVAKEDAVGRKCWEVFHSSLCDGDCAIRTCMKDGGQVVNKSIFIVRPNGERVPVSISASQLTAADGTPLGGVETFRDLTDIHMLRREMEASYTCEDIIGKSPVLAKVFAILPQVAASPSTVLLTGETGTGKELFARALHNLSPRAEGPFVAMNCGALPENLLESELFGYKAGAFTDAKADKPGRFATAKGGTIFLDEVGDMPSALQVKLLRVLQESVFEPLGATAPETADVRVIAATNRDLDALVEDGSFRRDLFYRLNVVQLRLPPLRERTGDIPLLTSHFVRKFNLMQDKDIQGVSEDAQALLMRHGFPGNVRELKNILEYAFILCPSGFIQVDHLPEQLLPSGRDSAPLSGVPMTMDEIKRRSAVAAVERHGGKRMAACRELGITKDTLRRLLGQAESMGE